MVRFLNVEERPDVGIAIDEFEGRLMVLDFQEGFCWDHGHHLGPRCPRCRPHNGEARMSRRPRSAQKLAE
jgi:hypothetical protein